MANIESNTLLEKLSRINSIKNKTRQAIIDIGGGDYINTASPFSVFPDAIRRTHSDIKNVSYLLEYCLFGGSLESTVKSDKTTYKDVVDYLSDIQLCKNNLVDNLRLCGIECSIEDKFEDLVNKVLDIRGESSETPEGVLYRTVAEVNGYQVEFSLLEDDTYENTIIHRIKNLSSEPLPPLIVKYVISSNGTTNFVNSINDIEPGKSFSLSYRFDNTLFNKIIEGCTNSDIITQMDTFNNCTHEERILYVNRIYNDINVNLQLDMYFSNILTSSVIINTFENEEDSEMSSFNVPNGLVILSADRNNLGYCNSYGYYTEGENIWLNEKRWTNMWITDFSTHDFFLATNTELNEDYSEENIRRLRDNYLNYSPDEPENPNEPIIEEVNEVLLERQLSDDNYTFSLKIDCDHKEVYSNGNTFYSVNRLIRNSSERNVNGIMVKDLLNPDLQVLNITSGYSEEMYAESGGIGCSEEDYNRLKEVCTNGNMELEFSVYNDCFSIVKDIPLSILGYDERLFFSVKMYSSDKLQRTAFFSAVCSDDESLTNTIQEISGFALIRINRVNNYYHVDSMYQNDAYINFRGDYQWTTYEYALSENDELFLVNIDEYNQLISSSDGYSLALELYNKYCGA